MADDDASSSIQGPVADQNQNSVDSKPMNFTFNNNADSSAATSGSDNEYNELMARGSKAAEKGDYAEAVVCYRDAVTIRVAHFDKLAPECTDVYYKYGRALLSKVRVVKSDAEVLADGRHDVSDWHLAWDVLNTARTIVQKHQGDTMEKVEILSALGELAVDREASKISFNHFMEALSILQRLVEPDSQRIAELYCSISICLKRGGNFDEAILYCKKAMSLSESRLERLKKELENVSGQLETLASKSSQTFEPSSSSSPSGLSPVRKEVEIHSNLEKMLEDLLEQVSRLKTFDTSITSALEEIAEEFKVDEEEENAVSVSMSSTGMDIDSTGGNIEQSTDSTGQTDGASVATHESS